MYSRRPLVGSRVYTFSVLHVVAMHIVYMAVLRVCVCVYAHTSDREGISFIEHALALALVLLLFARPYMAKALSLRLSGVRDCVA